MSNKKGKTITREHSSGFLIWPTPPAAPTVQPHFVVVLGLQPDSESHFIVLRQVKCVFSNIFLLQLLKLKIFYMDMDKDFSWTGNNERKRLF